MPKLTNLLTDRQLKNWISKGEEIAKSDGDGLTFTLSKAGTASWVLRYRLHGRRKEVTLGNYPDISLSNAREKARALRAAVDGNEDVAAQKQVTRSRAIAAWTVRDLVNDYREKRLRLDSFAKVTVQYRNYDFDQVILPRLGSWQVEKVTPIDIVSMLKDCQRTWTITKRILTTASQLFDHACGLTLIPTNPCFGIKLAALMGPRPPVRRRIMLDEAELRTLLPTVDLIGRQNGLAFRILLATCVRGVELVKAKKEHLYLDRGVWWIPDDAVKTRNGFLVPLVPAVIEWFRELLLFADGSEYLLPARRQDRLLALGDTHVGTTTLWAAITRAFERGDIDIRRFTPHDTRSTAKGHMRNMGVSREISEIALNHTLKGMEAIYDVREEIPERREALKKWADFLIACEAGSAAPHQIVIQFRRTA
ncbi:site-specific integrase [Comamonas sp. 26]|uniref:tyrosine-type recombinase/integrase n=1 Tax=Comamonas sp. 26 TaxID=2035201 RepID=UPI000C1A5AF3|nr:site-specific integrase [Comamonas sp. 26]PIG08316.1 integrase [Comamonas sp. 26]